MTSPERLRTKPGVSRWRVVASLVLLSAALACDDRRRLSADGGLDVPASADVGPDVSASADGGLDLPASTDVGPDVPASTDVGPDVPASTDVAPDVPASTDVGPDASLTGAGGQPSVGMCHIDCYANSWCEEGVIYDLGVPHAIPCDAQCSRRVIGTCPKGCGPRRFTGVSCLQELCAENTPKSVGSPCATNEDCRPTFAFVDGKKNENVYLACDPVALTCIPRPAPPAPSDWLAPCTPALVTSHPVSLEHTVDWFDDPQCSEGTCLAIFSQVARQGCSRPCRLDDECPQGSTCVFRNCDRYDPSKRGACMPAAEMVPPAAVQSQ